MSQDVGRNDPCPCGSGHKYKHCCEGKTSWHENPYVRGIVLALVLGAALVLVSLAFDEGDESGRPPGPAPAGKVWSPEHGHWHDAY